MHPATIQQQSAIRSKQSLLLKTFWRVISSQRSYNLVLLLVINPHPRLFFINQWILKTLPGRSEEQFQNAKTTNSWPFQVVQCGHDHSSRPDLRLVTTSESPLIPAHGDSVKFVMANFLLCLEKVVAGLRN